MNPNKLTQAELEQLAQVIFDSDSDEEIPDDDADTSSDEYIEKNEHDSESEIEGNDCDYLEEEDENNNLFIAKDRLTTWHKNSLKSKFSKVGANNLVKIFSCAKQQARNIQNEMDAFMRMLTDEMLEHITKCTNIEISNVRSKYMRERDAKDVTKTEMLAFIGLLLLSGYKKQNHTHFLELWTKDGTGSEIFRACMSKNRFLFLLSIIRFDDKSTRNQRKQIDKLAAIRWVIDEFVKNCRNNYSVGEFITVDEMLIPFRGRCAFVQYIPNKPAKYGLKCFVMCDAKTFYVSNLEFYCGKQPDGPYSMPNTPTAIVHRLLEEVKGSNRNLTCDNWYSSYPLAKELLENKITMIGTMKKNKREIPPEFLPHKTRPVGSSLFGFQKNVALVSYVPKKNKSVVLISTMHDDGAIDPVSNKPDIILQYNATKGGVDTVDKMCSTYSVGRRTRRWPLAIFFQLINIAGINSQLLYNATHVDSAYKHRREFLKEVSLALMKPHLSERASMESLPSDIKCFLAKYKRPEDGTEEEPPAKIRARCFICGRKRNRVTTITCGSCRKFVCKQHMTTVITCDSCKNYEQSSE